MKIFNLSETPKPLQPKIDLVPRWLELNFTHPNTNFESGYCSGIDETNGSVVASTKGKPISQIEHVINCDSDYFCPSK